jgi:Short-chain alcohol dehydrogenase of unknown specificity
MNIDFRDRTAIVTGAAHGFGRAISVAFARLGARVWACDLREDELRETRRLCELEGGACISRVLDVRDKVAALEMIDDVVTAAGRIDILVNNAGGVLGQVGRPLEAFQRRSGRAFSTSTSAARSFSRSRSRRA